MEDMQIEVLLKVKQLQDAKLNALRVPVGILDLGILCCVCRATVDKIGKDSTMSQLVLPMLERVEETMAEAQKIIEEKLRGKIK